jgi:hypothetical protein
MRSRDENSSSLSHGDAFFSSSRKEPVMHSLSGALTPRLLVVLVAVLVVLMILTVLFLLHMHVGTTPMFVQSTDNILD